MKPAARPATRRGAAPTARPPARYDGDLLALARDLLGVVLLKDGVGGPIVEVEAYHQSEPASHGHRGETRRNRSLFLPGGHLYVYRIHQSTCCNVVVGEAGVASAVLIRGLLPTDGREVIATRRQGHPERSWTDGPGKLCQALGITLEDDGLRLSEGPVRLEDRGLRFDAREVIAGPRVGISQAVDLPWRFRVRPEVLRRLRASAP